MENENKNAGCTLTYFCGRHKNNFPLKIYSSLIHVKTNM